MLSAAALVVAATAAASERVVYVAPGASEKTGAGSFTRPYTLAAAVRAVRGHADGVSVLLRGGDYVLSQPLVLTAADSGGAGRPVTYMSAPGERARLLGGIGVPASAFQPISGSHLPAQAVVADLRTLGVRNASMLGGSTGVGQHQAELFMRARDGSVQPLQLAQDPNPHPNGTWQWAGYSEISAGNKSWFVLADTAREVHLNRWGTAVETGLRLYGHWGNAYNDMQTRRVQSMVPVTSHSDRGSLTDSEAGVAYNITFETSGSVVTPGQRFVAVDALALLDSPGEYWIDRVALKLYLYPPVPLQELDNGSSGGTPFVLSLVPPPSSDKPLEAQGLIELRGASHVRLANLTLAASTRSLLVANASTGLSVEDCSLTGAAGDCSSIQNAANSQLLRTTIAYCGGTGLTLTGGSWYGCCILRYPK